MNREIKFRAWDKKRKIMVGSSYPENWGNDKDEYWDDWVYIELAGVTSLSENKDFEVMQYTGLKDTNGVEIYEGDIVTACYIDSNGIGQKSNSMKVIWGHHAWGLEYGGGKSAPGITDWKWLEVIGNIYENPEILTN